MEVKTCNLDQICFATASATAYQRYSAQLFQLRHPHPNG